MRIADITKFCRKAAVNRLFKISIGTNVLGFSFFRKLPRHDERKPDTELRVILGLTKDGKHKLTNKLYCIVLAYRRLMPPEALQPKASCTNPGLQSFLLAPSGVSTRDPSSERRNYLGEKWPMNFA